MTETPKRRGRPLGSKNKKPDLSLLQREVDVTGGVMVSEIGPAPVRVILVGGMGFSKAPIEREVEWPQGWPLPRQFESVIAGDSRGQVHFVTYDLDRRAVIIAFG